MIEFTLQTWAKDNRPNDNMLWKEAFWNQIIFMRDKLIPMMYFDYENYNSYSKYDEYHEFVNKHCIVSGAHRSKSILNPVLTFFYNDCIITMRYNYYDWNVSIINSFDLEFPDRLFNKEKHNCYFQGFPEEYEIRNCFNENKQKFSCNINNDFEMYLFMFLLREQLGKLAVSPGRK